MSDNSIRPMTREEKNKVSELVMKIDNAMEGEDPENMINALCFYLFGAVRISRNLSERQAVEFCIKHFKTYAQVVFS